MNGYDPEVIKDFLTESGELLEELDADLVSLEDASTDPDLLNQVFRALHTIKGSASFLALTNLVEIAHAAEDALNAARKGEATIDRRFMDLILEAVDVLKVQFAQLENGEDLAKAPDPLVAGLVEIGTGAPPSAADDADPSADDPAAQDASAAEGDDRPLTLPENKQVLVEFMVDDLEATLETIQEALAQMSESPGEAAITVADAAEGLARTADFFQLDDMARLVQLFASFADAADHLDDQARAVIVPRLEAARWLLAELAESLRESRVKSRPVDTLIERAAAAIKGDELPAEAAIPENATTEDVLAADLVTTSSDTAPAPAAATPETTSETTDETGSPQQDPTQADASPDQPQADQNKPAAKPLLDQTIRVEVGRLEALLNLVGELVLQKNRIGALSRQIAVSDAVAAELIDAVSQSSSDLDRVTGDIQNAVMRTRLQPLDKIFGKYPRLIRDLARKTGKNIKLVIEGGETEVDKSVIEELGDPLVHLLRNSADHGVENPEERAKTSKPETGTIKLAAAHEGSHVMIRIIDDGKGLPREKIGAKAVERGVVTQEELDNLTDREVYRFIFHAGLSTAEQVSDLSGRGVGMDVVRSNIEKLKGTVDVDSKLGEGTTIYIKIPLTVAIMPAMMVGVAKELYAVPLQSIVEIVRADAERVSTINGRRVLRIRDSVLPLVRVSELFDVPETDPEHERFVVIVELNEQRAGLVVTELIGQQEIVVKPLDSHTSGDGAVSGATVRDDGGVSLIVDVERMIETVHALAAQAA